MNRFNSITKPLTWFMALLLTAFVAGCGGGSSGIIGAGTAAPATVTSIAVTTSIGVTPATASIPVAGKQQFVATVKYSDSTTSVVTTTASWTSSNAGATVGLNTGLAIGVTANVTPVIITATFGGKTATAALTVTSGTVLPVIAGTVLPGIAGSTGANATNPTVIFASPSNGDIKVPTSTNGTGNVVTGKVVTATFNEPMIASTVTAAITFTLKETTAGTNVSGTVTMNAANTTATFTPIAAALKANTGYTATVTTAAQRIAGSTPMPKTVAWSFTTNATLLTGQALIDLGLAGNYVIFADTSIQNPGAAGSVTGNIGVGPAVTSTAITGFGLILDSTQDFSASSLVVGKVYAFDYKGAGAGGLGTTPTDVTTAANNMLTAYTEAAGRTTSDTTTFPTVEIGGKTIPPGLYKWTSAVGITTDVTLDAQGDTNAVWIFQIAQDLNVAAGADVATGIKVVLANGAKASNVFWQVGGGTGATLGTYSTFNGTILSAKQVVMGTGAVLNGTALAQTDVTMISNTVTKPAP